MVALGWLTARIVCRNTRAGKWKFGDGNFERVAVPFFAYAFLLVGKAILGRFQPVMLLDVVQSLVIAAFALRIATYVLGHILPKGGFLRGSVRTLAWIAWIAVALHITGLLPDV